MVHNHRYALERRRLLLPARDRRLPALEERFTAGTIAVGIRGIELRSSDAPGFWELVQKVRISVIDAAARGHVPVMVMTFVYVEPDDAVAL